MTTEATTAGHPIDEARLAAHSDHGNDEFALEAWHLDDFQELLAAAED